jgi:hypothetical protein
MLGSPRRSRLDGSTSKNADQQSSVGFLEPLESLLMARSRPLLEILIERMPRCERFDRFVASAAEVLRWVRI